jgi:Zn-dependent protease/predicted transcriptional regulator
MLNRNRIEIFKLFGFPIRVDVTWLLILLLVTSSLAEGFFPINHPGLPVTAYWAMGFVAAIGLFLSIIFHELSHSLVARHYQIKIDGITLFIFGGVAEMRNEPASPKVEFLMAIVGPLASILLAVLFFYLHFLTKSYEVNRGLVLIFYYLGYMNALLAGFNLVPAFPLDGGRVFRSILWAIKKDYSWATRIAAAFGKGFGWILIALGALRAFQGDLMGGFWYVLIGFFLKRASQMSLSQLSMKKMLQEVPVTSFMQRNFVQLRPQDRLFRIGEILGGESLCSHYPVMDAGHLVGYLSLNKLNELTREMWETYSVLDILERDLSLLVVDTQKNAWQALEKMREAKASNLFVMSGEQLDGVVTAQDLMNFVKREA